MTELPTYVIDRTFDAPRELVWRAWTDPTLLPRWYGPRVDTTILRHELREGGVWLSEMRWGGSSKYDRIEFTEIVPIERLVWIQSSVDADGNIVAPPMMADWPRKLLTVVTLEDAGDQTALRLTWQPHEASHQEIACFAKAVAGMGMGWGAGLDLMAELLMELQS